MHQIAAQMLATAKAITPYKAAGRNTSIAQNVLPWGSRMRKPYDKEVARNDQLMLVPARQRLVIVRQRPTQGSASRRAGASPKACNIWRSFEGGAQEVSERPPPKRAPRVWCAKWLDDWRAAAMELRNLER
jgi:hypothetical protein